MAWKFEMVADVRDVIRATDDMATGLEDVADTLSDVARDSGDVGKVTDELQRAERAAQDVATAGEDVADALDDVKREAGDAGDAVERELGDSAKEAGDEADKLEKKFRSSFDEATKGARDASRDVSTTTRRGFDDAGDAVETFRDEAKSNLSETVSSFRGDVEDLAQIAQDILGGVVADLGPAGAAAGAVFAAGIGIGIAALQNQAEEAEEVRQRVLELADTIREADGDLASIDWGAIVREWGNAYADVKSWFEPWQRQSITNFEEMEEKADRFGLSYANLVQGMAGNTDAGRESLAELNAEIERQQEVVDGLALSAMSYDSELSKSNAAEREKLSNLQELRADLMEATGLTEEAVEHEQRMAEAMAGSAAAIAEKNEALTDQLDLVREAITSELDYLDALDEGTAKLKENAEDGFDKNTAAGRDNLRVLADMSGATLEHADALAEQTGSQEDANRVIQEGRDRIVKAAEALGMSRGQAERYADSLGLIPRTVDTTARAHTSDAERALDNLTTSRYVPVHPSFDRYAWQRELTNTIGGLRVPAIVAQVRYGQAAV